VICLLTACSRTRQEAVVTRIDSLASAALAVLASVGLVACGGPASPLAPDAAPAADRALAAAAPPALLAAKAPRAGAGGAIVIERGELDLTASGGTLRLAGTRGFSLTARVTRGGGIAEAFESCLASPCAGGTPISLEAAWSGSDLPARVTLDGVTHADVGSVSQPTTAEVRVAGRAAAPPVSSRSSASVTADFVLSGSFVRMEGDTAITETFTGGGTARVSLARIAGAGSWSVERVVYRIKR
jgi:hypothetical protein